MNRAVYHSASCTCCPENYYREHLPQLRAMQRNDWFASLQPLELYSLRLQQPTLHGQQPLLFYYPSRTKQARIVPPAYSNFCPCCLYHRLLEPHFRTGCDGDFERAVSALCDAHALEQYTKDTAN